MKALDIVERAHRSAAAARQLERAVDLEGGGNSSSHVATLSNGIKMPLVGYGCAGRLGRAPLLQAIQAGYRLFDTSQATEWYLEEELGAALNMSGIDRKEFFLTTKLHPRDLGEARTLEVFPNSLKHLGTSYIDAFLLHYPKCFGTLCGGTTPQGTWRDSWRALEALYDKGQVRAIGVSNFDPNELSELIKVARIGPHLVQSWMDPLQQARALRKVCEQHGVLFQAYSTLGTQWAGQGVKINPVLRHPLLGQIGKAHEQRHPAQVALRWALQHGVAVIPRSSKRKNMVANLALFDFALGDGEMAQVDALDGTDPRAIHAPPPPPRTCQDESEACGSWADSGECDNNPGYMHKSCAASCDTCPKAMALEL